MAVVRRLLAILDLQEISDYVCQFSPPAASRFLDEAEATIHRLEQFPKLGRACRFRDPALAGVRKRLIHGTRYMLYYLPIDDGIEVLRILHGSREVGRVLGESDDD
jgi:toxin ParE1/3/4